MEKETAASRAKRAWKAFSVQAIVLLSSESVWYPLIETTAVAAFGDNARIIVSGLIGLAGILGWTVPQKKKGA